MQVAPARRLHPGVRLLLAALRLYQRWLSPLMPASCRFYPTCSHYAYEAIERHGPMRGLGLTLWRLLRCQPLTRGGFDPVPTPGSASHDRRAAACEPAEGRP